MPITSKSVTIATTATAIHTAASNGCRVHIFSASGGQDVTLGPATVVAGTGYLLLASSKTEVDIDVPPGETLYGITSTSTKALGVLVVEY